MANKKIGLVLEGGGMRGMYTAGVIDIMLDHAFEPDVICGTSAGATFGVNLPSKQRGRVIRYNTQYAGHREYISIHSWLTTGNIINVDFAYNQLPWELDPFDEEAFEASKTDFYATITNVRTGHAEYVLIDNCRTKMDAIRASASLPMVSKKVEWQGEKYLDGGLVDNIPLDHCLSLGCDKVIVVLTHPEGYVKHDRSTLLCNLWYPFDHQLLKAIAQRNSNYNKRLEQIKQLENDGKIIVLRPSTFIHVGRLESDPNQLRKLYELGLHDAESRWNEIEQYLQKD